MGDTWWMAPIDCIGMYPHYLTACDHCLCIGLCRTIQPSQATSTATFHSSTMVCFLTPTSHRQHSNGFRTHPTTTPSAATQPPWLIGQTPIWMEAPTSRLPTPMFKQGCTSQASDLSATRQSQSSYCTGSSHQRPSAFGFRLGLLLTCLGQLRL